MRPNADDERIRAFLSALGRAADKPVRVYLVGGATAVLEGWRRSTIDVDLRIEPDTDDALLRRLTALKEELDINIELASPPDFIPELPGWRERSPHLLNEGLLEVRHFDPYSQALSKIERGFEQDLEDVNAMLDGGLVERPRLLELFEAIEDRLFRYPAIDAAGFRDKVLAVTGRQ